jgi:flagella basal body P-ring formation protein FlgA
VPANVKVLRTSIIIPKEKIEKIVVEFLYGRIPWEKNRVKIKEIQVNDNVILPEGNVTYRIVPPKNIDFLGTIPLSILFNVNGSFKRKVWATVKVEVLTEVVVTKRPLKRYQLITDEDVILKRKDLRKVKSNAVTSTDEALGKRSKRVIKSNVILTTNHIELPPLVKRGDVVEIIAESVGLRITTLGEVRSRGCRGERIKVVNLDSGKAIYARVMDSNTVKVDF